jgi:hypothetical protein
VSACAGAPLAARGIGRNVPAVPVHDQDPSEALSAQRVEEVVHDGDEGGHAQRRRSRIGAEGRRKPVGEHGQDGDAERLCGLDGDALGQEDREHDPVVTPQVLLELEPVQIAHPHSGRIAGSSARAVR